MIKRYTRSQMAEIWTEEYKYKTWLEIEILACESMAKLKLIPEESVKIIRQKANFSVEEIEEIEKETKHDVIAFTTNVAQYVGPDARYIHMGLTSSDILDTSLAVRLKKAGEIILQDCDELMNAISEKALLHKNTVMIGRSHGIHAEPITFGLKLAVWYDEMRRNKERFIEAQKSISTGMISGAVGTFANISPEIEEYVCKHLDLNPAPASTQVIQRDRHAHYFSALAIMASTIEKIAIELRHLQRTEVLEVEEYFSKGQKGSSAMPHKRNPISAENLSGLARLIRSNSIAALENIPLWHERDISHSSVERVIAPDSTILMDYMLARMTGIIKNLLVYPEKMQQNLDLTKGLIFSQQIMLELVNAGASREDAYKMVQKAAMKVWKEKVSFKDLILNDKTVLDFLEKEKIEEIFNINYHLKHVDYIFQRVFEKKT